jgi:2,3-bisphosphoglycerate-independent phosphoglycerate mutase
MRVIIKKSTKPTKKLMAIFIDNYQNEKIVHFGSKGMSDFTIHKDPDRKKRYLQRHKTNENWNKPKTAGALSRWILWNKTSLRDSINHYKKKFRFT